jgi:hypothetical protein
VGSQWHNRLLRARAKEVELDAPKDSVPYRGEVQSDKRHSQDERYIMMTNEERLQAVVEQCKADMETCRATVTAAVIATVYPVWAGR